MPKGGYRQPGSPAPVSGPGALSKRTDGPQGGGRQPVRVPTGGQYGQATQLQQLQQGAPVAASPGGDQVQALQGLPIPEGPGAFAPSDQPDVPVTDGAASGPGAGMEALGLASQPDQDMQDLVKYLPVLEFMANIPGASRAARNAVRSIKAYKQ